MTEKSENDENKNSNHLTKGNIASMATNIPADSHLTQEKNVLDFSS